MSLDVDIALARELVVADAARTFARRSVELTDSIGSRSMLAAQIAYDWALHELLVRCGEPCGCDEGTCPSAESPGRRPSFGPSGLGVRVDVDPAYL